MGRRFDVIILEMGDLPPSTVERLRGRCRLLLAYVNLGYAEDWRDYWPGIGWKSWVHEPTEYEGEYLVEYWSPNWRDVILDLIDEAHRLGFEGVLLDNVDVSIILRELRPDWCRGIETEELMIKLIESISETRQAAMWPRVSGLHQYRLSAGAPKR